MNEPVEYQMRMRPTWEVSSWSDWEKCSRDSFDDYIKTHNDWCIKFSRCASKAVGECKLKNGKTV
jgi:hypothetical protein